jgi:hypothetical protein
MSHNSAELVVGVVLFHGSPNHQIETLLVAPDKNYIVTGGRYKLI